MEAGKLPRVYSVSLKPENIIKVDVDRYTVWFRGQPTDRHLAYKSGMIHGKQDPSIGAADDVAKLSIIKAGTIALRELRFWARENPGVSLDDTEEVLIWLNPECGSVTPEQASINRECIDRLIKQVSRQLPHFPPRQEPLP